MDNHRVPGPVSRRLRYPDITIFALIIVANCAQAGDVSDDREPCACSGPDSFFNPVPTTISDEAQDFIRGLPDPATYPASPAPDDIEGWRRLREKQELRARPRMDAIKDEFGAKIIPGRMGGVPILDIRPATWQKSAPVIVFIHGGGYTLGSAASSLAASIPLAHDSGMRVISIDYSTAPAAGFREILDEATSVIRALYAVGFKPENVALVGVSAGGGIAMGATLKMRDDGTEPVGAIVLWSPTADLSNGGETWTTLRHVEPAFDAKKQLNSVGQTFAPVSELTNPYVSPVYGQYDDRFPPTLIQGGTRETLLSGFVRLYRVIDSAGADARLDLYEGMVHAFQEIAYGLPESGLARQNSIRFLRQHLVAVRP